MSRFTFSTNIELYTSFLPFPWRKHTALRPRSIFYSFLNQLVKSLGRCNAWKNAKTHNDPLTPPSAMSSNATLGMETYSSKRNCERRDAYADGAIPGLPNHLVVAHLLRSEYFDDPADLALLPSVSRAMRDMMAGTVLIFEEIFSIVQWSSDV